MNIRPAALSSEPLLATPASQATRHGTGTSTLGATLFALFAGLLSACAFEPLGLWPLMPLAFAVLALLLSRARSLRAALLIGWSFGVGQFVLGLNWIATAFTYQAAMPAWLGWVAVVLLSLYLAVFPAMAAGLGWRFGQRSRLALVLALAGGWALTEYLRALVFTGFAWNPVGVTLLETPWLNAIRFTGTYALSALVVALGGALFLLARREWKSAALPLLPAIVLLFVPPASVPQAAAMVRPIRIVQHNIGQEDKWREGLADETAARLVQLSAPSTPAPRLLFWPEVAVVEPFQILGSDKQPLPVALPAVPRSLQSIDGNDLLITGAFALIADDTGTIVGNTNSVFALDRVGRSFGRYDKAHLVPYGEYLPMRPLLTAIGLSQLAPGIGDTAYGPGPRTLDLGSWGRMGVQICYEIIFSGQVVDGRNRPDFIFNPSNDAWFGPWGPPQHLAQARLRAAEEGLPVLRSTPTGISAVVDARGTLLHSLPLGTGGVIDATLPPPATATPFASWGNVLPMALAFGLLIIAIVLDARRRYSARI